MKQTISLIREHFSHTIFTERDFNRTIKPLITHIHTKHLLHALAQKGKLARYGCGRYKLA